MQNKPNSRKQFWKDNGYYILLGLCLVVVGVSGYFLFSGAMGETEQVQEVLSIPATVEEPEQKPAIRQESQSNQEADSNQEAKQELPAKQPSAESAMAQTPEVVLPVAGAVLRDHAMDRLVYDETTRDWRVHDGVDLAADPGQDVKAARAGTVLAVYEDDTYGMTVVLEHADGYTSRYCNLAETVPVSVGETVSAGQIIGMVGATALMESAAQSHLHFAVSRNGEPVDPASFLY